MKNKHVHRGVNHMPGATGNGQLNIGKVARIHREYVDPATQLRQSRRARRNEAHVSSGRALSKRIASVIFVFVLLAVTAGAYAIYKSFSYVKKVETGDVMKQTFEVIPPTSLDAEKLVRAFLSAKSTTDLKAIVRLKDINIESALQLLFKHNGEFGEPSAVTYAGNFQTNGESLEALLVDYKNGESRLVYLIPNEAGKWQIDAESFFICNDKTFDDIFSKDTCRAKVRAIISPGSYYNGVFSDETQWACLEIKFKGQELSLNGYVRVDSPQQKAIMNILRESNPGRAVLVINRRDEMEVNQYEVTHVLAQDWLETSTSYEKRILIGTDTSKKPMPNALQPNTDEKKQ